MGRKHFTEEQIAFALGLHDGGTAVGEIIRKLGISEQAFYRWRKTFAGLGVAEPRRLKPDRFTCHRHAGGDVRSWEAQAHETDAHHCE